MTRTRWTVWLRSSLWENGWRAHAAYDTQTEATTEERRIRRECADEDPQIECRVEPHTYRDGQWTDTLFSGSACRVR